MLDILRNPWRLVVFCLEGALVAGLFVLSTVLHLGQHGLASPHLAAQAGVYAVLVQISLYYVGHYDPLRVRTVRATFGRVLRGLVLASAPLFMLGYLVFPSPTGRVSLVGAIALTGIIGPAWRTAFDRVAANPSLRRVALIMGDGPFGLELARTIRERADLGLRLAGILTDDASRVDPSSGIIGAYGEVARATASHEVGLVLVACSERRGVLPVAQLLDVKLRGIEVENGVAFYERATGKVFVEQIKPSDLIFAEAFAVRRGARRLKRIVDIVTAAMGLLLAAPLFILVTAAVKIGSRGPLLYRQTRAGEFGDPFTIYKFRTMREDAEREGAQFALENDPRVTGIGRLLRKARLDELPQLWNVMRGDMSMVGPRPERPEFVEMLAKEVPFFKQRLYLKPGITGHAQVRCTYGASTADMAEKLQYDLYYIKNYGLLFDLSILLDTVKVVVLGRGSR